MASTHDDARRAHLLRLMIASSHISAQVASFYAVELDNVSAMDLTSAKPAPTDPCHCSACGVVLVAGKNCSTRLQKCNIVPKLADYHKFSNSTPENEIIQQYLNTKVIKVTSRCHACDHVESKPCATRRQKRKTTSGAGPALPFSAKKKAGGSKAKKKNRTGAEKRKAARESKEKSSIEKRKQRVDQLRTMAQTSGVQPLPVKPHSGAEPPRNGASDSLFFVRQCETVNDGRLEKSLLHQNKKRKLNEAAEPVPVYKKKPSSVSLPESKEPVRDPTIAVPKKGGFYNLLQSFKNGGS